MKTDLYSEILKYEDGPSLKLKVMKSEFEFADEIALDERTRDDFLQDFVDDIIHSMSTKEIAKEYSKVLLENFYNRLDRNEESQIVQECANRFPHILTRFKVAVPPRKLA